MYLKSTTKKSRVKVIAAAASLGFAFLYSPLSAQEQTEVDASLQGYSQLTQQIITLVQRGNVIEAIPQMEELATRIEGGPDDQKESLEPLYFYLGVGYMEAAGRDGEASINRAIEWLTKYIENYPQGPRIHLALSNRGDCFRATGQFEKASEDFIRLLTPPEDRFEDMTLRISAHEKLTNSLYILEKWDVGIPWFQRYLNITTDEEKQAQAAGALIRAYISKDRFEDMMKLLPLVVRESPIRYDLALNVELLRGGDRLVELGRVQEASLLYYLAQTGEEIVAYLNRQLRSDERSLRLLRDISPNSTRIQELETNIYNYNAQIKQLQEMPSYTPDPKWRLARTFEATGRSLEAYWAFSRLIDEYPRHQHIEDFMYASFMQANEALLLDETFRIGQNYLNNSQFEKYGKEVSITLVGLHREREEYDEFFKLAYEGLENYGSDPRFGPQYIFLIGSTKVQLEQYEELKAEFESYIPKYKDTVLLEGVYYWSGLADIFLQDYDSATKKFEEIIKDWRGGVYYEDARFRMGVIQFATDRMEEAYATFKRFVDDFPTIGLRGEAEAFLGDITASVARVPEALEHYALAEEWTNRTTGNMGFINHSVFQRGKLYEANKRYHEMAEIFQRYINQYRDRGDISSAVYQLGRAKEFLGRPEEMLAEYREAITRFGNDPTSFGIDNIIARYPEKYREYEIKIATNLELREKLQNDSEFRTKLVRDRRFQYDTFRAMRGVDETFKNRLASEQEFRDNLLNNANFRNGLLEQYARMKNAFPDEAPATTFRKIYDDAHSLERRTLALRVEMALDKLGERVSAQTYTPEDIEVASPATLIWISSKMQGIDPDLASKALLIVLESYRDSDFVFDALVSLGDIAYRNRDYAEALSRYQEAEARFPAGDGVTAAILKQGDSLIQLRRFEEAEKVLDDVQRRRGVAAVVRAEASYKLGLVYLQQENYERAHAFFQRTYIAFPTFTKWSGQAYLKAGEALEKLGRRDDARATYQEFLELPEIAAREPELYQQVQSQSARL